MWSSTLHVFTRRDVHGNVVPFVGRDFGKTAFLQRFARRYDLHDTGVTGLKIALGLPVLGALRARPGLRGALAGVNAVVVGILAAALVTPVGTAGITSPAAAVVAGLGAGALLADRVPPLVVVVSSALAMAGLSLAGIG